MPEWFLDAWVVFLMQNVPLEAAHLFYPQPSWDGYLPLFSPKKQLPRHTNVFCFFRGCAANFLALLNLLKGKSRP
jgi:hypothetical protein